VHFPASSFVVRDSIDECRISKRHKVETRFDPDVDINFLSNELEFVFFIEEDPKTYEEAIRSIDNSF